MKQIILLLSLIPFLALAEIYKTTDADGNTIYTDIPPNEEAKELKVEELNVSDAPKKTYGRPNGLKNSKAPKQDAPADRYIRLAITAPANEKAVRNNEGKVTVSVALTPKLYTRYNDKLSIAIDGVVINDGKAKSVNLEGIDRGTHTITAYVQDEDGMIVVSAQPVTFNMFRFFKRN